jgi:two-component system response regulator RstA
MAKICIVEDDEKLAFLIQKYLVQHDYQVDVIGDGDWAVEGILSSMPDLVVLDLMLPGKDGLTICREIRQKFSGRILFLTASEDNMDQVAGIELGADDFIVKPVEPRVLLARIRMLLRRVDIAGSPAPEPITDSPRKQLDYGQLSIYYSSRSVTLASEPVSLTTSEFDLLWLLANHAEEVLSRDDIYRALRGIEYDGLDRSIDTKVANLRKKLGDRPSLSRRIITVRGQGYLFVPDNWDQG